jgi:hypothetical protein
MVKKLEKKERQTRFESMYLFVKLTFEREALSAPRDVSEPSL